jgi:hypothetical protein
MSNLFAVMVPPSTGRCDLMFKHLKVMVKQVNLVAKETNYDPNHG